MKKYKVLERNGIFMVGYMESVKKRKYFWSKPVIIEEWRTIWMGLYKLAHFETLELAMDYARKVNKPDVLHEVV